MGKCLVLIITILWTVLVAAQFEDRLRQEGKLVTVELKMGNPVKILVVGREEATIDPKTLTLTVKRLKPGRTQILQATREGSTFAIAAKDVPPRSQIEISAKVKGDTEVFLYTVGEINQTRKFMTGFLESLVNLKPYLIDDKKFSDPKNSKGIGEELKKLADIVKETRHDPILNIQNFKFSRQVLDAQLVETERVFRLGNKSYARWMMNSTLNVCMGCHTQSPTGQRAFGEFMDPKDFKNEFDRAEFLFMVRDFAQADKAYNKVVAGFPGNDLLAEDLETAMGRQMGYYVRVKRDFDGAQATLKSHQMNQQLPDGLQAKIGDWIENLKKWQKIKIPDPATAKATEVIQFAEKNWWTGGPEGESFQPKFVSNLVISGILFDYLRRHPQSKKTPDILYWLSISDNDLGSSFFYPLSELYLRECIVNYPAASIAPKCFEEYQGRMILGYSGSSGLHLPAEVAEELKSFKKLIDAKGKIPKTGPF